MKHYSRPEIIVLDMQEELGIATSASLNNIETEDWGCANSYRSSLWGDDEDGQ